MDGFEHVKVFFALICTVDDSNVPHLHRIGVADLPRVAIAFDFDVDTTLPAASAAAC